MFEFAYGSGKHDRLVLAALSKSLGIIEFDVDGTIVTANENFCQVVGYGLEEIKGKHHSMFVIPEYAQSQEYREFWKKLASGEFDAREYKRIGKGGREVWIQASYNPVKSGGGKVLKVVKFATDITQDKLRNTEFEAKLAAISRAQAVIEFLPTGEIITANENFLATLGYCLSEVQRKHHRMFVDPSYAQSTAYRDFWAKLRAGEFISAEFVRYGKNGQEVWIQASYNPVFDLNNKVVKVVKFATDITPRVIAVGGIAKGLSHLAEKQLHFRIDTPFGPTFERLRVDLNASFDGLQSSMQSIATKTGAIQAGVREITSASDELARRTEQQAANLEETAAALDQITKTVKKSAEGAAHAREVVSNADRDAKQSAVVVRQAIDAMDTIAKSAQQISQIIGVIDEIAFQTNLLALNAGVEAARAGEAGRGFAVVASEVRALAQRSAEAAKEIKGLISTSGIQVDQGVKLVTETGKSLERILGQVNDLNGVVSEIAAGAKEESIALAEINTAIAQMDQGTQQNAAMAQETTAASHALSSDAGELSTLVGKFDTGADPAPARAAHKASSPKPRAAARPMPQHGPAKKVANGGTVVRGSDDWDEF